MLIGIHPLLGPDLLYALQSMGHGDEIAIVDGNYPAEGAGPEVVRLDGLSATRVLARRSEPDRTASSVLRLAAS